MMAFKMNFYIPAGTNIADIIGDGNMVTVVKNEPHLISDGYVKIGNFSGNKEGILVTLEYKLDRNSNIITTKNINFTPSSNENSLRWDRQVYEHLKTTDEFKDAVDVFE